MRGWTSKFVLREVRPKSIPLKSNKEIQDKCPDDHLLEVIEFVELMENGVIGPYDPDVFEDLGYEIPHYGHCEQCYLVGVEDVNVSGYSRIPILAAHPLFQGFTILKDDEGNSCKGYISRRNWKVCGKGGSYTSVFCFTDEHSCRYSVNYFFGIKREDNSITAFPLYTSSITLISENVQLICLDKDGKLEEGECFRAFIDCNGVHKYSLSEACLCHEEDSSGTGGGN